MCRRRLFSRALRRAPAFLLLLAAASCGRSPGGDCLPGPEREMRGSLGSRLSMDGGISDPSLVYTFKPFRRGGTLRDLANYIYFQGDTVCFSFCLGKPAERDSVEVGFIDPATGRYLRAERIDLHESRVSGFSLVGSLLEGFNRGRLNGPPPRDSFCCRDIPFEVMLSLRVDGLKREMRLPGSFRIEYTQ